MMKGKHCHWIKLYVLQKSLLSVLVSEVRVACEPSPGPPKPLGDVEPTLWPGQFTRSSDQNGGKDEGSKRAGKTSGEGGEPQELPDAVGQDCNFRVLVLVSGHFGRYSEVSSREALNHAICGKVGKPGSWGDSGESFSAAKALVWGSLKMVVWRLSPEPSLQSANHSGCHFGFSAVAAGM